MSSARMARKCFLQNYILISQIDVLEILSLTTIEEAFFNIAAIFGQKQYITEALHAKLAQTAVHASDPPHARQTWGYA